MKAHIGSDVQGRVHSVAVTDAAVHDSVVMDECLHGEEAVIYGDKAYASEGRRQEAVARGIDWRVNRKARRGKRLNCADRSFNRKSNRTRSRVEHAFGVVKHLWGYRKVRYRGLEKNAAQVFTLFCPGQFLPGQAGVGRNMRVDLSAGWEGMRKSLHGDEERLVGESDVTRFSQKLDNIFKNGT